MADEQQSLSGWESLPTAKNNDDDGDESEMSSSAPVVIELPPEGFPYPVNRNASSSDSLNWNEQRDGSTTSSYSIVNRIDNVNLQESTNASGSASSSLPRSVAVDNNALSISSSLPYSSQISRTGSISSSTDDDSLISQFDYISVSGETQKRCRKCKFNNSENSVMCKICGRALVANPNISMDKQIAIHLHQKELQNAQILALEEEERNRQRQRNDDPLYDFALVLAKDIRANVSTDTDYGPKGFHALPEQNLVRLGIDFLERAKAFENAKISFAYKITASSDLERIKEDGFSPRSSYRPGGAEATREVGVSTTIGAALLSFRQNSGLLMANNGGSSSTHLVSIPEYRDPGTINQDAKLCWIVAAVESVPVASLTGTNTATTTTTDNNINKMLPFPAQVLPLVYFDNRKDDDVDIRPLLENLLIVFKELFKGSPTVWLGSLPNSQRKPKCVKISGRDDLGRLPTAVSRMRTTVESSKKSTVYGKIVTEGIKNQSPNSHVCIPQKDNNEGHSREHRLFKMTAGVWVIAVSSRGTMAEACDDRKICLWSEDLGHYNTLKGRRDATNSLAFSPPSVTNEWMASGDMRGVVKVWDTSHRGYEKIWWTLNSGGRRPILDIRFFPSGKTLAVVDSNRECWLWKLSNGTCTCRLKGHRPEARNNEEFILQSAAFSPDGQSMASTGTNSTYIYYWTFNGAKELLTGHKTSKDLMGRDCCHIRALSFAPEGSYLASAATDGTVRLWDIRRNPIEQRGDIQDLRNQRKSCEKTFENIPEGVCCLAFSPNGKLLAGGGIDGVVRVWDVEAGCQIDSFAGHSGTVKSVAFFPDGRTIVSSALDRTLRFWIVVS